MGAVIECSPPRMTGNSRSLTMAAATRRDLRHDIVQRVEREFHFRQCVNADGMNVGVDLLVVQLQVRRGRQNLAGTISSAGNVRGRAIERNRQHHNRRVLVKSVFEAWCRRRPAGRSDRTQREASCGSSKRSLETGAIHPQMPSVVFERRPHPIRQSAAGAAGEGGGQ